MLAPRGRAAVAVWGPIGQNPAFAALAESLQRRAGVRVAAAVRWLFCLPEPATARSSGVTDTWTAYPPATPAACR